MSKERVSEVMIDKAKSIALGADLLAQKTNDWQTIRAFLRNRMGEIELTDMQQEKLRRYQFVFNQMSGFKHSENDVINQLQKQFTIRPAQAYEDMASAKELYAFVFDLNKAFELRIMLDANAAMMFRAKEASDMKSYAMLEKNRVKMVELIQEAEENPGEDFEPHTLVIQFNPVLIGADPNLDMTSIMNYINEKRGAKINTKKFDELEVKDEGE